MPRYFFDLVTRQGNRIQDLDGVVMVDDDVAQLYGAQVVEELKRDEGEQCNGWNLEIRRDERIIASLRFQRPH